VWEIAVATLLFVVVRHQAISAEDGRKGEPEISRPTQEKKSNEDGGNEMMKAKLSDLRPSSSTC
jgi:hypothetical protein